MLVAVRQGTKQCPEAGVSGMLHLSGKPLSLRKSLVNTYPN